MVQIAIFPQAGSLAAVDIDGQAAAVRIIDHLKDGSALVEVEAGAGRLPGTRLIVASEDLADRTPLDDAERLALRHLADRAAAGELLTRNEQARLVALRLRVATDRICQRLLRDRQQAAAA